MPGDFGGSLWISLECIVGCTTRDWILKLKLLSSPWGLPNPVSIMTSRVRDRLISLSVRRRRGHTATAADCISTVRSQNMSIPKLRYSHTCVFTHTSSSSSCLVGNHVKFQTLGSLAMSKRSLATFFTFHSGSALPCFRDHPRESNEIRDTPCFMHFPDRA